MRILIYGAGVIGSIFAGRLVASGQDITVLARGKRLSELSQNGIVLSMPGQRTEEQIPVKVIDRLAQDDIYDYVLVVMQRTQVANVMPVLTVNRSRNIVFVVNTAAGYEEWVQAVGADRLMIGFPSAGGERMDGKVVYFIGKGLMRTFQTTTFGEYSGQKTQRVCALIEAFNHAGIPSVFCANMDSWQKTHVAMVTSIGNALYQHNCSNRALSKSYNDMARIVRGIKEGFAVLRALGYRVTPRKLWYFNLPTGMVALVFKVIMGTQLAEITMAKHCVAAKAEMRCLQSEFDALIAKSGISTPAIDALHRYLYLEENIYE
ncbi:MAG: ketopantoate reductase family protein [Bacteroidia bacterium]|nr:ketopantoate reductase family protein [Bacteroidia bacterium]